jgi:hypothetical protein
MRTVAASIRTLSAPAAPAFSGDRISLAHPAREIDFLDRRREDLVGYLDLAWMYRPLADRARRRRPYRRANAAADLRDDFPDPVDPESMRAQVRRAFRWSDADDVPVSHTAAVKYNEMRTIAGTIGDHERSRQHSPYARREAHSDTAMRPASKPCAVDTGGARGIDDEVTTDQARAADNQH